MLEVSRSFYQSYVQIFTSHLRRQIDNLSENNHQAINIITIQTFYKFNRYLDNNQFNDLII